MKSRAVALLAALGAALPAAAAGPVDLDRRLAFEESHAGAPPTGWAGGPNGTLFADSEIVHGGAWSARIERDVDSANEFSALTGSIPMGFSGKTIELRGFLKTESVSGWAGLWMRQDDESGSSVAFENMQSRRLSGTTDWAEYRIELPIDATGVTVFFGALLVGEGKVWVDDLRILVDGEPIEVATVPEIEIDPAARSASNVTIDDPTARRIESLAMLGRVWGFLKYHHPRVVAGEIAWDDELFRVLPSVLAATNRKEAQIAILDWARALGEIEPCDPCATIPSNPALRPDLDWIRDRGALGKPLVAYLEEVYRNRPAVREQAYVALAPDVGNPVFRGENGYSVPTLPDDGYRLLMLFRFWNVVRYWSPYRDVIGSDWDEVLDDFVPRMVEARDLERYRAETFRLVARLDDGHANLWNLLSELPPRGTCRLPVVLRAIEGRPVVSGYSHAEKGPSTGLAIGDVVRALDGIPIDRLLKEWKPYYSASNEVSRTARMFHNLPQGPCVEVRIDLERAGKVLTVTTERLPAKELDPSAGRTPDLPGPAFRRLSPEVAYLKLSGVKAAEIPAYLEGAEGTKGWIIDIRNYPAEFVVFSLGAHFVAEPTPFARFTVGDPANPGAFHWIEPPLALAPAAPRYEGKVVILVDETSISQAEYTAMALRANPNAVVVGSTTAGADGNVSPVPLPGGLSTLISGIGVFYPDRTPTQRIGIVPDIEVRPTIAGIRAGRDEVIEEALRVILGKEVAEEKIRDIARSDAQRP